MIINTAPEKRRRDLTDRDAQFVKVFFECNGDFVHVAEKMGIKSADEVKRLGRSPKIQHEIMRQLKHRTNIAAEVDVKRFDVSKDDRMELLWSIAQGGAERIIDKEGNAIFMNPAVSVSAIRTLNEMIPGSIAPTQVEVTHKRETRTELEVMQDIKSLQAEINSLALEGEYEAISPESEYNDAETVHSQSESLNILAEDLIEVSGISEKDIKDQTKLPRCEMDGLDENKLGQPKSINTNKVNNIAV